MNGRISELEEMRVRGVLADFKDGTGYLSGFYKNFKGGKWVQLFEEAFAKYIGVKHAIAVSSGTAALHTAIEAVKTIPGDKGVPMLTTPATFVASASSIVMANGFPVFCDVSPRTLTMDPFSYGNRHKLPTPRLVIAVHILGHPCDMQAIQDKFPNAHIIEDCAQSLGAKYRGKMTGTLGDLGCFSSTTRILTPEGAKMIRNIELGDKVLTPSGPKTVREVHKRQYSGEWTLIQFGKLDSSFKLRATAEHPIYSYNTQGGKAWRPISQLRVGDEIFVPVKSCQLCSSPVPFYRKYCDRCYGSQTERARDFQRGRHLKHGERLQVSHNKHFFEDVAPVMARLEAEGYRVIPIDVKPTPDLIAIKDTKVIAVEVESKVTPRLSKVESWAGVGFYDDLMWVTRNAKKRSDVYGHASYSIDDYEGHTLARIPVLATKNYRKQSKHASRTVYNLTVEDSPTYFAKFVLVHNCFSFQETKTLTTLGEGGMVVTNSDIYADHCRSIRNHGEKYARDPKFLGYNYRMTEPAAAFGLAQLERLDETMRTQIECAREVKDNLPDFLEPFWVEQWADPSYFIVATQFKHASRQVDMSSKAEPNWIYRAGWIERAMKALGWESPEPGRTIGPGYTELIPDLPFFKRQLPYYDWEFPAARFMLPRMVWFDVHRWTTKEIVRERMQKLKEVPLIA